VEEEHSRSLFLSEEECRRILFEVDEEEVKEEKEMEEECRCILLEEEEEVDVRFHVYICNVSSYCLFSKIAYDIPDNSQSCQN
jgi:hypothetical protein